MKTKYTHIYFEKEETTDKNWPCWSNTGVILGYVEYHKPWKKWVIETIDDIIFDSSCLRDIADFMEQLEKPK